MESTMTKRIYFDNAATTPMDPEVIATMTKVMQENYGNPSSIHADGRSARALIEQARKTVAERIGSSIGEIFFTSGGTESNNMALKCAVRDLGVKHIITSRLEHHCVLHALETIEHTQHTKVSFVNIDNKGRIDLGNLESLLANSTEKTMVTLMHSNNEIGTMIDLDEIAQICETHDALFHTDTVQTMGYFPIDVSKTRINFLTGSAHKFHGPKGVGFAFVRKNSGLKPLIVGGAQERGLRAGTESVHNIVGLETALQYSYDQLKEERAYISDLKMYFAERLINQFPDLKLNGSCFDPAKSTYTLLNVCLPISQEKAVLLLFQLDMRGIACSKGSACQSGSDKGSHVLREILSEEDLKKPSIRFSFSRYNTKEEVDYVIAILKEFIGVTVS